MCIRDSSCQHTKQTPQMNITDAYTTVTNLETTHNPTWLSHAWRHSVTETLPYIFSVLRCTSWPLHSLCWHKLIPLSPIPNMAVLHYIPQQPLHLVPPPSHTDTCIHGVRTTITTWVSTLLSSPSSFSPPWNKRYASSQQYSPSSFCYLLHSEVTITGHLLKETHLPISIHS